MKVRLEVITGKQKGRVFEFMEPDGFVFGRCPDCTCVVDDDPTFSRHHFLLEINPPNATLKDLGSLNGTKINGKMYGGRPEGVQPEDAECSPPIPLRDGDRIKAGEYEMLLGIEGPPVCVDCGKEIPTQNRRAAEFIGGSYLCKECREKEDKKRGKREEAERCAKDKKLSPEKPQAPLIISPQDVEISLEQRKRAEQNPGLVVDELIRMFLDMKGREKGGVPEIEGYRDLKKINVGGFGAIYEAYRTSDRKKVALKTMLQTRKPDPHQAQLFEREKTIAIQLRHVHIVHCERASEWKGIHFIEMEFMDGGSVCDLMEKKGGRLSLDEAKPIMLQALEGLAFAHKVRLTIPTTKGEITVNGVVHRDLKPPNILLCGTPGEWTAKLADFGIAKAFAAAGYTQGSLSQSVAGSFCGSPPYMAPEHIVSYKYVKPETDVFEMAASFYHILTGHLVWEPRKGQDIYKLILEGTVKPIRDLDSHIPRSLADVFDRCLKRKPQDRYKDAGEMLKAIKKVL
jgi:pSer/pThr/pTyr-binding forkhead associated (FHA) protein